MTFIPDLDGLVHQLLAFSSPFVDIPIRTKGMKPPPPINSNSQQQQSCKQRPPKVKPRPLRKSPLYHNAKLEAPDGQPLCVCDVKKAQWYLDKGFGAKVRHGVNVWMSSSNSCLVLSS